MELRTGVELDYEPATIADFGRARRDFPWYASRFLKIADKNAPDGLPHPLFLNIPQQVLLEAVEKNKNAHGGGQYLILKARQLGTSTLVTSLFAWRALSMPGFRSMVIAHDNPAAENLLSMVKLSYNGMSEMYECGDGTKVALRPNEKASNHKELHVIYDDKGTQESRILIASAGAGEGVGRSFALNGAHFSEVGSASFDDGKVIGSVMQTLADSAVVFAEGTANGAYGWFYETWNDAVNGHNDWTPVFIPWFVNESYSIPLSDGEVFEAEDEFEQGLLDGASTELIIGDYIKRGIKVKPEQVKWLRWVIRSRLPSTLEMTPEQWRAQEYPSNSYEAFISSGAGYFHEDVLKHGIAWSREYKHENKKEYIHFHVDDDEVVRDKYGDWTFIRKPDTNRFKYVVGGDVAEGLERGDFDTACVVEVRYNEPNVIIGYWRGKEDDKGLHARQIKTVANWCNAKLVAIENNLHGYAVNEHLDTLGCRGLYIQTPDDEGSFAKGYNKRYGWRTGSGTKGIMLAHLQTALRKWFIDKGDPDGIEIPFPEIWEEYRTYIKINKKVEASPGNHDDLVIASAIANTVALDVIPRRDPQKRKPRPVTILDEMKAHMPQMYRFMRRQDRLAERRRNN